MKLAQRLDQWYIL